MKLIISKDADHCAAMVAHILEGQLKNKADSWIALPYSPSFKRVYEYLVEAHQNKEADFSKAHFNQKPQFTGAAKPATVQAAQESENRMVPYAVGFTLLAFIALLAVYVIRSR